MAVARRLGGPPPPLPNQNVAGPPVIVLELDVNEAEAVRWFLIARGRNVGEVTKERQEAASGKLNSTSLAASAIRVADALIAAGV